MKNLFPHFSASTSIWLKATAFASATLLFAAVSLSAQIARPLLDFNFNGSGNTETSTGTSDVTGSFRNDSNQWTDLHSGTGGGVSGLPGDLAFNNTASTQMGGTSGTPGAGG